MPIDDYQFGFKVKHSTGLCTKVLKRTVDYYTERGSHVFCAFIDFSKAFDRVNYWHLFNKLLDDNVSHDVVRLLSFDLVLSPGIKFQYAGIILFRAHLASIMVLDKEAYYLPTCLHAILGTSY